MRVKNLWRRFQAVLRPEKLHDELSDELRFHVEMTTSELMARGVPEAEARTTAAERFGDTLRIQEESYDVRGGGWTEELWHDTRFAFRILRKTPAKTGLLVLTLALGIGANTGVFSIIKSILLDQLPFADADQLVLLNQANKVQAGGVSYPHYKDWVSSSHSFQGIAVYSYESSVLTQGQETSRLFGAQVSANIFNLLKITPVRGRLFRAEEDRWPGGNVSLPVLISDRFWRSHFQAREDIQGQRLLLDSKEFRIVGVVPEALAFPVENDMPDYWTTVAGDADPARYSGSIPTSRGYPRYDGALARLKPGVTTAQARAEMTVIAAHIAQAHPKATSMDEVRVTPALESLVGTVRPMLLLLYGGVFCILLVACANAATLLLVSATARGKEFAVRAALGAKSTRLMRQLLIESVVVAISGGLCGILLAWALVGLFRHVAPPETPRLASVHLDLLVLLYATLVSVATGLFFGLVPAASATRIDLVTRLKETSRAFAGRGRSFLSGRLLIAVQISLSMALTCCAAVLGTSFAKILTTPRGFDSHQILTASVSLPVTRYAQQSASVTQFYDTLLQRVRALPGVVSASSAQSLPLSGQSNGTNFSILGMTEPGQLSTDLRFVEPDYFRTMRIPLTGGRVFSPQDRQGADLVAVVNEAFVRRYLKGGNPYSAQLKLGWGGNGAKQIVGVVGNIRHGAIATEAVPEVYVPMAQFPLNDMAIVVRTATDPVQLASALRGEVAAVDSGVPLEKIRELDAYLLLSAAPQRFLMWVMFAFAGTALLLSAIGLYGVLSYATRGRTFEFGVRMALGSTPQGLLGLVLRQGIGIASTGIVAGLALAVFGGDLLSRWLYETTPTDPLSLGASSALLLVVAVVACLGPAWRATAINPLTSLRAE